jgi:hypothetical protein
MFDLKRAVQNLLLGIKAKHSKPGAGYTVLWPRVKLGTQLIQTTNAKLCSATFTGYDVVCET